MAFRLKENEQEARERLRAFWAGSSLGRPALHVTVNNPEYQHREWRSEASLKELDYDPEYYATVAERAMYEKTYLAEAMPMAVSWFGSCLTVLAVMAGGDYTYHDDSAWIDPIPDLYDRPLPTFDPAHPFLTAMTGNLRRMAEVVGDQGAVNPPVLIDGLTTLSNFRTPDQLCFDLLERPEMVHRWREALTTLYIDIYEYFYQFLKSLGYGESIAWLEAMAEGRMEAVQCDFGVMLSPEMYEEFAIPQLRRMTDYLDYSLYHLDGTCQLRFLDLLRTLPKLNGIQCSLEPGAGPLVDWLDAFKEIRRRNFCLHLWCTDVEEAVVMAKELGPDGLMLVLPTYATRAEAEEAIRRIERVC